MKGFVPNDIIDQIRLASDIVEIIEENVPLKKSGKNFTGLCPFHSEKTPSFSVSPEKQIYHCFGCGEGGNVFSFLMKFDNLSFPEAVTRLGKRYGITVPVHAKNSSAETLKNKQYEINKAAAEYFHKALINEKSGKAAWDYLRSRNISSNTIKKFLIGYADRSWSSIVAHFQKKNTALKELEKAGLIKSKASGTEYYDRFRNRIIFPIQTHANQICGFGGRDISNDSNTPKYINTPESSIYNKRELLYGFNVTKESIRAKGFTIIVEGYFDLVSLYQHGFENVVATCGTALTNQQAGLVKRYSNNVILLFDSDEAGYKATARGFETLLAQGLNVKVIDLPDRADPDSFINRFGSDKFNERISRSVPFIDYLTIKIANKLNLNSLEERINGLNAILPFLSKIKNSIERTGHVTKLAECFKVSDKSLLEELRKAVDKKRTKIAADRAIKTQKRLYDWSERNLVRLIILNPEKIEEVKKDISCDYFFDEDLKEIVEFLFRSNLPKEQLLSSKIVELLPNEKSRKIVTEFLMETIEFDNAEQALRDCIQSIIKKAKKQEIGNLKKQRIEAANSMRIKEFQKLDKDLKALQGF